MSDRVSIGVGLLGHVSADAPISDVVELATLCEARGLDSFWVADQRWMRDVYITLGAVASATTSISLGVRVTDPYVRHPAVTAAALASLDEFSGGRAVLGISAGGSGFQQMGISRTRPAETTREAIELIRLLWNAQGEAYQGNTVSWSGGTLEFPSRPDIPVIIAARAPRMLQMAGEVADGVMLGVGSSPASIEWAREQVEAGEALAGRPRGDTQILHMTYIAIHDDAAKSLAAARRGVVVTIMSHPHYHFLRAAGVDVPKDLYEYMESGARDPDEIMRLLSKQLIETIAVVGTPAECAKQLSAMVAAGIEHISLAPLPAHGQTPRDVMDLFTQEVMPLIDSGKAKP